jgi:rhodanese-related sulfurtransferase
MAGELALAAVLIYIGYKWWERRRFNSVLRLPRVDVEELRRLMTKAAGPVIVDVRSALGREQDRRCIPGALEMSLDEVTTRLAEFPMDREIVFYCACPNEASAAFAARKLLDRGYVSVRPLRGGLDAWAAAGYEIELRRGKAEVAAASAVNPLPPAVPQS